MLEEILKINEVHEANKKQEEIVAEVILIPDHENPFDDAIIDAYLQQADKSKDEENEDEIQDEKKEDEIEAEVIELGNEDDPDDEEVIAFYLQQSMNRKTRNGPTEQASNKTKKTQPNQKKNQQFNCDLCDFKGDSMTNINLHKEASHTARNNDKCGKCDFRYKSKTQLEKHNQIAHTKEDKFCWYWENTFCSFGTRCRFIHRNNTEAPRKEPCFYQENCRKPNCRFEHRTEESFLSNPNGWK